MVQPALGAAPTGFAQWLSALDFALGQSKEIAIVGEAGAQELLHVVWSEYRPDQVVAYARDAAETSIPLLLGRTPLNGQATAHVCRNFVCQLPVTEPEALTAELAG
jgi:uncharacterized protein